MFAPATVVGRGDNPQVKHGDDSGLLVRFYFNKIKEKDYVKINVPGDSKTEWDQPATDKHKLRFKAQWEAYQAQQSQFGTQTLLEESGLFSESQIKTYKAFNIETVENLAAVNDTFMTRMGPGVREDQRKARAYLAELNDKAQKEALQGELQQRDKQIKLQDARIKELESKLGVLMTLVPPDVLNKAQQADVQPTQVDQTDPAISITIASTANGTLTSSRTLDSLPFAQLRKLAKQRGIKFSPTHKKAELIELLNGSA